MAQGPATIARSGEPCDPGQITTPPAPRVDFAIGDLTVAERTRGRAEGAEGAGLSNAVMRITLRHDRGSRHSPPRDNARFYRSPGAEAKWR